MRKKFAIALAVLGILSLGGIAFAEGDTASNPPQGETAITFPIPELGNCSSKDACKLYCSNQAHIEACISFGESHGLMGKDEAARARTFATMTGPGGCKGEECKTYCDSPDHVDECLAYAEAHGLVKQNQSGPTGEHIRGNPKIQELLAASGGPGGCKSEGACRVYCSQEGHMNECLQFGKDNGLMTQDEYDRAQKFITMTGPGGCRGEECKAYCDKGAHTEECLKFGEEKGFITKDEADKARTFVGKPGPGGCKGEECRTYCADQSHHEECVSFAVQNGFLTQAEADRMQQNMQTVTGPGGCMGETCRSYCEDAAHRDECVSFAKERGMMGPPSGEGSPQPNQGQGLPRANMTPEQQKQYNEYIQSHGGQQSGTRQENYQPGADIQHQEPYQQPPQNINPEQQRTYQQYQQNGATPPPENQPLPSGVPTGSQYPSTPPPGTPPPPPPTSSSAHSSFVANVFSIFSRLFRF